jgi:hypothetical protein
LSAIRFTKPFKRLVNFLNLRKNVKKSWSRCPGTEKSDALRRFTLEPGF